MDFKVISGLLLLVAVFTAEGRSVRKELSQDLLEDIDSLLNDIREIDTDGDGQLTAAELTETIKDDAGQYLTDEQIQQTVDQTIAMVDQNGDGQISLEEFLTMALASKEVDLSPEQIQEVLDYAHDNYNRRSTKWLPPLRTDRKRQNAKLLHILRTNQKRLNARKELPQELIEEIDQFLNDIRQVDTDGDGQITAAELTETIKSDAGQFTDEQIQQMVDQTIAMVDQNGDGQISLEEFLTMTFASKEVDLSPEQIQEVLDYVHDNYNRRSSKWVPPLRTNQKRQNAKWVPPLRTNQKRQNAKWVPPLRTNQKRQNAKWVPPLRTNQNELSSKWLPPIRTN